MQYQALDHFNRLSKLSFKIVKLKDELLEHYNNCDNKNIDQTNSLYKNLGDMESYYNANCSINIWPMNKQVLVGIWGTQTFLFAHAATLWKVALSPIA
jgi:hypothetical protein